MGRKQEPEQQAKRRRLRPGFRYALYSATFLLLAVAALFVYSRVDQFLASDPRFRLAEPPAEGGESPALQIEGVVYASRATILSAFSADYGRSVYLLPLAERRRALLAIDWVREASVTRLWPDRVAVRIEERTPVAFIGLPAADNPASYRVALIDAEGVILEQPPRARFTLPVLAGIRPEQSQPARRLRVTAALRMIQELGSLAGQLSEIDVSDAENLKVVQQAEGKVLLLMLGNRNFLSRLQNFVNHYPEIQQRSPDSATFDLRLDDRITAVGEDGRGG
jgi:cell division protein FtsQ